LGFEEDIEFDKELNRIMNSLDDADEK